MATSTTISRSGGFEGSNERLMVDGEGIVEINYRFEHFGIPDRFQLVYDNAIIFDSGFTGGSRTGRVPVRLDGDSTIGVRVITDNAGTAWNYTVSAALSGDLYPYQVSTPGGPLVPDPMTGEFSGTGGIGLGLISGRPGLLTIDGSARGDKDTLTLDGLFGARIGGATRTLFDGAVNFALGGAPGLETVVETGAAGANEFELAGLPVQFNSIQLADDRITAGIRFDTTPANAGGGGFFSALAPGGGVPVFDTGPGGLIIDDNGARFRTGLNLTQVGNSKFKIYGSIDAELSGAAVSYDGVKDELKLNGQLQIESPFIGAGRELTLDLTDSPGLLGTKRGITINPDGVTALGTVNFKPGLDLRFLTLEQATFGFSQVNGVSEVTAGVGVRLPNTRRTIIDDRGLGITSQLKFLLSPFEVNGLTIGGNNLNVPLGLSPLWLDSVQLGLDNLAGRDPDRVRLEGGAGVSYLGIEESFNLVGQFALDRNAVTVDGRFTVGKEINIPRLGISDGRILSGLVELQYDWSKSHIVLEGNASLAGLLSVNLDVKALYSPVFRIEFGGKVTATLPSTVPLLGGTAAAISYRVSSIIDNNSSNDSVAFYATLTAPVLNVSFNVAVRAFGDGTFDFSGNAPSGGSQRLSAALANAEVSSNTGVLDFTTRAGQAYALLVIDAGSAGAVVPTVTRPDGVTIAAADFLANNIEIVDTSPGDGQYLILIAAPQAGAWRVNGTPGTVIGVDFPDAAPTIANFNVAAGADGLNRITLDVADDRGAVTVRLFADEDGSGFNGTFITEITGASGLVSFDWSGSDREAGSYRIYAVVDDGRTAPVESYGSGTAIVGAAADLAVTTDVSATTSGIDLTIAASNTSSVAGDAVLVITLPDGFRFGSTSLPVGETPGSVTIDLGTLAAGASTTTIVSLLGPVVAGQTIRGTTEVRSSRPEPDISDNISVWRLDTPLPAAQPSNLVYSVGALTGSGVVDDRFEYTVTISNTGAAAAEQVTVRELFNGGRSLTAVGATASVTNNLLVADLGTLAPGATTSFVVQGIYAQAGGVRQNGEARTVTPETTLADNRGGNAQSTSGAAPAAADLAIALVASDPRPDDSVELVVTVNNAGPSVATGIDISVTVPAGVTILSANPDQGSFDPATGRWSVGNLRDGGSRALTLQVKAVDILLSTTIIAEIIATQQPDPDSTPGNGLAEDDRVVIDAPLRFFDIVGDNTANTLTGTDRDERIAALGGNDTVRAGGGNDYVEAGDGDDSVEGGSGDDDLRGGNGADWLFGGDGNDRLDLGAPGAPGPDIAQGEAGNDVLIASSGSILVGGAGTDTFAFPDAISLPARIIGFGGGDRIDLRALADARGFTGTDAIDDGFVIVERAGSGTLLRVIGGTGAAFDLAVIPFLDPRTLGDDAFLI